jgi:hypothetical protein
MAFDSPLEAKRRNGLSGVSRLPSRVLAAACQRGMFHPTSEILSPPRSMLERVALEISLPRNNGHHVASDLNCRLSRDRI